MKFILGKKLNMSQVFTSDGERIPVTVLEVGPCKVVQVKTKEKEGYSAVQLGWGYKRHLNKPLAGHQKGEKFAKLREFRVDNPEDYKVGQEITVKDFQPGEFIDVSGLMKGRGFAGVMKRHGFHGFPASHGHDKPRSAGSIGSMFPQHTRKGMRMAGRMGGHSVTVKNLLILDVDAKRNLIFVKGAVPGTRNGLVKVKATGKKLEKAPQLSLAVTAQPTEAQAKKPAEIKKEAQSHNSVKSSADKKSPAEEEAAKPTQGEADAKVSPKEK